MRPDPDEQKNLNPADGRIQAHYDRQLGPQIAGESNTEPSDENELNYTGDADRDNLADAERSGAASNSGADERREIRSYRGDKGGFLVRNLAAASIGSNRSKIKKRIRLGIFGTVGIGGLFVLLFMLFMLASGFGVKQAAIVAKNYGMYRLNRLGHSSMTRVLEGNVRVKSGEGLSAVTPSSALDRVRGLDIEKVLKNLESEGSLKYVRGADGNITNIVFKDTDIAIGELKGAGSRVEAYNKLSSALEIHNPELAETRTLTGKVADGVFERTGLQRLRWSEKVLSKFRQTKTPVEALGVEQEQQLKTVTQDPPKTPTGDPAVDAAREVADEGVPPIAAEGKTNPVAEVIPEQIDAIEGSTRILSRNAAGEFLEGASAVAIYSLCTINAVNESYDATIRQSNDASIRLGGQLQSAGDQIAAGVATAASIGAARKSLDDFQNQASYQKAAFNSQWADYKQLAEIDRPQPRKDKGWMKVFSDISIGTNSVWNGIRNAFGGQILEYIPFANNVIPVTWTFTEFCGKINTIAGGLLFGIGTAIIEQALLNALIPGAGGAAGGVGKEAVTEGFLKKLISSVGEKGLSAAIKEAFENVISGGVKKISDISIEKIVKKYGRSAIQGGAVTAATVGMTYLIIKLANGSGGHTYSGTSDQDYAGKAIAGTNVMQSDLLRTRKYGVPTDPASDAAYLKQQYAEHLNDQSKKSLADRFLNINNPYSASARIASAAPFDKEGVKTLALNTLNPLNALGSTASSMNLIAAKLTDQKAAYAKSADDEAKNDGVQQWGFTLAEEELMKQDAYSLENISIWAGTPSGKAAIEAFDLRFGVCYDTKYEMSDILLGETIDGSKLKNKNGDAVDNPYKTCLKDLPNANKTDSNLLKWRLYHQDILSVDEVIDLQDITQAPAASPNPNENNDNPEVTADSTGTPCATGTEDLGVRDDAYTKGQRIKIRLCAVNSIPGSSEESTGGVPGANGRALVSSVASGAWQKLGEAAKAAGIRLSAGSSWRTMAHQERLCREDDKCPSGNYNDVAQPGTSNHQAGTAIDISEIYGSVNGPSSGRSCSNPQTSSSPTYRWVASNARGFGIKNYANEAWHWGTSEAC